MSRFLIFIVLLLALDFVWLIASDFLLRKARSRPLWRIANGIFLGTQAVGFGWIILSRIGGERKSFSSFLMADLYLWHLLVLPTTMALGFASVFGVIFFYIKKRILKSEPAIPASADPEISVQTRRQFLLTVTALAPPVVNLALTGYSMATVGHFRVREMTLRIPNLPRQLNGMTMAHVTDLHAGPFTTSKTIRQIASTINDLHCDLIFFTGDLINSKLDELSLGMEFMPALDAKYGVTMVEGNHDLFIGRNEFTSAVRRAGLQLLANEASTIRVRDWPVQLLGLRWGGLDGNPHNTGDANIRDSFKRLHSLRENDGAFPILLAHHPHVFDEAAPAGLPLTLAGHTHGGQLMMGSRIGAGPMLFRYWSGLYQKAESQLVVSNGVGNWFPLRTFAPAEIIRLTLIRS